MAPKRHSEKKQEQKPKLPERKPRSPERKPRSPGRQRNVNVARKEYQTRSKSRERVAQLLNVQDYSEPSTSGASGGGGAASMPRAQTGPYGSTKESPDLQASQQHPIGSHRKPSVSPKRRKQLLFRCDSTCVLFWYLSQLVCSGIIILFQIMLVHDASCTTCLLFLQQSQPFSVYLRWLVI